MIDRISPIVEGHGEVSSIRTLLDLILASDNLHVEVTRPIRLDRGKIVQPEQLRRHAQLAQSNAGPRGGVLLLFDADDDCPVKMRDSCKDVLLSLDYPHAIAVANRQFESWFLASISSISGHRGLLPNLAPPADPEAVPNPKTWLELNHSKNQMGKKRWRYSETLDQAGFTSRITIEQARSSRSFLHLENAVKDLVRS